MVVQNYFGRNVDHTVQFDPPSFALCLVGTHAKPVDKPVAGVSGTASCKGACNNIADDSGVDLAQILLGDFSIRKPYRILDWRTTKSYKMNQIWSFSKISCRIPICLRFKLFDEAYDRHCLGGICPHASHSCSDLVGASQLVDNLQNLLQEEDW